MTFWKLGKKLCCMLCKTEMDVSLLCSSFSISTYCSHDDSLNESDCPSDSLNEEDLSKPQPLLQCNPERDAISVPHNIDHEVIAVPSTKIPVEEEPPKLSSSVEPSADAQALLEDFGFSVKLPVPHADKDSGAMLMGYEEPILPPQSSEKVTEIQSLFDDLGFDVGSSAPIKHEKSPISHVNDMFMEQPPSLEGHTDAQSLFNDFGFEGGSSVPFEPAGLPKLGDVPTTKQTPISETGTGAQTLLDDFGFDIASSQPATSNELKTTCPTSTEQLPCAEPEANKLLEDFGFDNRPPPPPHVTLDEANAQNVAMPIELLQPPRERNRDAEAQNLLGDFGFDVNLSAPSGVTLPSSNADSHSLLQFDIKASASRAGKDLPCAHSSLSHFSEQSTGAQNPLKCFGFDSTNLHVSDPDVQNISPLSQSASLPCTEWNSEAQNLSGFAELSIPHVRSDSLVPLPPMQNIHVTPLTSEQRNNAPNLLGDLGFNAGFSVPHTGEDLLVSSSHIQNTTMPSSEKSTDAQSLLKDFGFDVDSSVTDTQKSQNPTPSSSDRSSDPQNLIDDFGFDTKSSAPCVSNTHMVYDLLTPPSSSERNAEVQTLLDDFGFDVKTSSSSSANTDLTDTHHTADISPPPTLSYPSSDCKPVKQDLPLIAFTDEVVHLWQTEGEKLPNLNPSPICSGTDNEKAEQEQSTMDGVQDLESSKKEIQEFRAEERESAVVSVDTVAVGCSMEESDSVKKESRLPTPNQQLSKCSSFLRSVSVCL